MDIPISIYWNTVRHLKPIQIWGRIWNLLPRPGPRRVSGLVPRRVIGTWKKGVVRRAEIEGPRTFCLLNRKKILKPKNWEPSGVTKLWKYHLHYFDDLNAKGAEKRQMWHSALITSWIRENAQGKGTGWEPYPTSRRVVNWVKYFYQGHYAESNWLDSLATQTDWLSRRIERHLLGNHVLANAKALIFSGIYFCGPRADSWLQLGMRILKEELPKQLLPDGGHFERSPMYHSIILEDLLDILQISEQVCKTKLNKLKTQLKSYVKSMLYWNYVMQHPDGDIPFFNDSSLGIAAKPAVLSKYARMLGIHAPLKSKPQNLIKIKKLKHSGFVALHSKNMKVLMDIGGSLRPEQPGHIHAEALAFELSVRGQRVFVNSGISTYEVGSQREWERGTGSHNCLELAGKNSSEVWKSFRLGHYARCSAQIRKKSSHQAEVKANHNGYVYLPGKPIISRCLRLGKKTFQMSDKVSVPVPSIISRLYLHPSVKPLSAQKIRLPSGDLLQVSTQGYDLSVRPSKWYPEFGKSVKSHCLHFKMKSLCGEIKLQITKS